MPYLLDGNNLIGTVRRISRPGPEDHTALVEEIAARLRRTRAKAVLFFDGPAGQRPSALGNLTVRVPRAGSADDAILAEIERARAPGEMVVVTADRALQRRVRDAGGAVCRPEEFFARFGRERAGEGAPAENARVDVDDWIRYFEDERNRE